VAEKILELAFAIAAAEEVSRSVSPAQQQQQVVVAAGFRRRTSVVSYRDVQLPFELRLRGPACVDEVVVESTGNNFFVELDIDGSRFQTSFDWLQSVSQNIDWIDAFSTNGSYVTRFSGICFLESFSMTITSSSGEPIKLTSVVAKVSQLIQQ
jgi:hypothetical protein